MVTEICRVGTLPPTAVRGIGGQSAAAAKGLDVDARSGAASFAADRPFRPSANGRRQRRAHRVEDEGSRLTQTAAFAACRLLGRASDNRPRAATNRSCLKASLAFDARDVDDLDVVVRAPLPPRADRVTSIAPTRPRSPAMKRETDRAPSSCATSTVIGGRKLADHRHLLAEHVDIDVGRGENHFHPADRRLLAGQPELPQRFRRQPAAHAVADHRDVPDAAALRAASSSSAAS